MVIWMLTDYTYKEKVEIVLLPSPNPNLIMDDPNPKPIKEVQSRPVQVSRGRRSIVLHTSAYTKNDAGMNGKGITTSGTKVKPVDNPDPATGLATMATDPKVIPLGSIVVIPSLSHYPNKGRFLAEDTGGMIKGKRVDLCFTYQEAALQYGRRTVEAYIEE